MSIANEITVTVGTVAIVKIGRNEVEVTVTEVTANGWKVKSQSTGREFEVRRIVRIVAEPEAPAAEATEAEATEAEATEPEAEAPAAPATASADEPETEAEAPAAEEEEDNAVNPAPESGSGPRPEKKLSLLNAAAQVLAACRTPMNCKEMIAKAVEMGLWTPTGAKTPEQTLYSGIFREIKSTEEPRFKKSETRKGSFEYAK